MFVGHFAVGLALKRLAPRTSLGSLVAAPQVADLLWPIFLVLGWERVHIEPGNTAFTPLAFDSYPISHSLLTLGLWGMLFASIVARRERQVMRWVVLAVVSHWVLDVVTHRPDMPLWPFGGPKLGLGLWNSIPATLIIEGAMFVAAVALYARTTRAKDGVGRWGFVVWVALLVLIYLGSLSGPPPPDVRTLAWTAFGLWLFPLAAWWFDRHRTATSM
jgi:membrane-bound metal-dependent hydrolase YbcI (DUF457 family)